MRRGLVCALAVAAAVGAPLARSADAPAPIGFDHLVHDGKVVASGAERSPGCDSCHRRGKDPDRPALPNHATCFTAGCHVMPKGAPKGDAVKLCLSCHATATPPRGKGKAVYPPFSLNRDYALQFAHDRHAAPAAGPGGAACEPCHAPPGSAATTAGHGRCSGCHTVEAKPAMSECVSCHLAVAGRDTTPAGADGPYDVGATFSHDKHLSRAGAAGKGERCLACHANVATTPGNVIPAPAMTSCESCHDGNQAFSALAPTCNRCHAQSDPRALPSAATPTLYSHEAHDARGLRLDCAACHTLGADGTPGPASADHAPCSNADCHASDFRSAKPRVCGACHVGTEPWRPLHADRARRVRTEFGVEFSHAAHLNSGRPAPAEPGREDATAAHRRGDAPRTRADCASCHTGIAGGPEGRLGRGHASCAGADCHATGGAAPAATGGAAPALGDCVACHKPGLLPARDRRRDTERWSVAPRFRHAPHALDAAGAPIACASCHTSAAAAATLAAIDTPRKKTCAPCHDGKATFKMTGHACARCHGGHTDVNTSLE